jgi:hypothetical protein
MTLNPKNWLEALEFYYRYIRGKYPPEQAQRIENETNTAVFHYLLLAFGFQRENLRGKMSQEEIKAAKARMQKLSLQSLPKVREALQQIFDSLQVSQAVRNVSGGRINQWMKWMEQEPWYSNQRQRSKRVEDQCAPRRHYQYGQVDETKLMPGKGLPLKYTVPLKGISLQLTNDLDQLFSFLSSPFHASRVIGSVDESTARGYLKQARLFLGWFHFYHNPPIPLKQLSLDLIFPKIPEDVLEGMTYKERKQFWRQQKAALKQWIMDYFQFLSDKFHSYSPRTRVGKLNAIRAIAHFQYASEVDDAGDYLQIPLFTALKALQNEYEQQVKEWTVNRKYVADQSKKWPDVPEGKTALKVVQEEVVEPLRQCCRPRDSYGNFHEPHQLASFLEDFLTWVDLAIEPARRQQEVRTRRISLICPIARPEEVPLEGLYHPLPPPEVRDKRHDGTLDDNYLYKTYKLAGKVYPQGIWVKEICGYKTRKFHGNQTIVIPNRQFADGTRLYDYIESYLYGWWLPGSFRDSETYSWWDSELKGQQGRWITKGRMEFEPYDCCCLPPTQTTDLWSWGYLFPVPDLGIPYEDTTFSYAFAQPAHERIGKRITPHTMRYIWATWAFQVGLSDAQLRSLAAAMGCTVETLRKMYERSTPEEKRRPIEEAIDRLLLEELRL